MAVQVRWNNIALVAGLGALLWIGRLIMRSVASDELLGLALPGNVNLTRVRYLLTIGALLTLAVGIITILKKGGGKDS